MSEPVLIAQGAEGRVYLDRFMDKRCIRKERFSKKYRHPDLDKKLTHSRLTQEARNILRCQKHNINTPAVYFVDKKSAALYLEYIDAPCVRIVLAELEAKEPDSENHVNVKNIIADNIGKALARMHQCDTVHGDLTTSNMLWDGEILTFIDFGLSSVSKLVEDKAVDLYVLERAFSSTHRNTESMFERILQVYKDNHQDGAQKVIKRLDEVRLRGRKRSMVG